MAINYDALGKFANAVTSQNNTPATVYKPATTTAPATTTTPKTYVVKAGDVGYNADIANKAQAYLSGGTYTAGQAIDTDWWGAGGGKAQMYGNNNTYKGQAMTTKDMETASYFANLYDQAQAQAQQDAWIQQQQALLQQQQYMMQQQYAANQEAIKQRTQATVDSINSNKEGINNEFEKAAKENYINSILQKNQTGDYMAAMGYNGGMTETNLANINANYENNRANAISERDSALREIERLVAEAQASGNSDLADAANNYYDNFVSALQNQANMEYQIYQDKLAQQNADRDYQLQLDQLAWNKQQYNDQRTDAANEAAESAKQQAAANDFDTFLNTYQGKYNKQATYEKWIENLKAMADPYGYNKQKIAYLTQYINSTFGGSGTTGSTSYAKSSTGNTKVNKPYTPTTAVNNLIAQLNNKFPAGITPDAKMNAVMNAIYSGFANGLINDDDKSYILDYYGY
jgi:hypothetical protein